MPGKRLGLLATKLICKHANSQDNHLAEGHIIELDPILEILQTGYAYLLVADQDEHILSISSPLRNKFGWQEQKLLGAPLAELLTETTLANIRAVAANAINAEGVKVKLHLRESCSQFAPIYCWMSVVESNSQKLMFFFDAPAVFYDWEKEERIKELHCLYEVAEWIEISKSEEQFFQQLPKYIGRGMLRPDQVQVWIEYQSRSYGTRTKGSKCLKEDIVANGQVQGKIIVGYDSDEVRILDEEQKLLTEIIRMIRIALERKWFNLKLHSKIKEEENLKHQIEELKSDIAGRSKELEGHKAKLQMVNTMLERSAREWEESKVRLERIFQHIPDHVAIIDLNHKVILTNQEKFTTGGKCYQTFFEQDAPCSDCRLEQVRKEKIPVSTEMRQDNTYYQIQSIPIFNKENDVEGLIEFYRDITKEKEIEQQLQQADKLASLGQLVSGIGHEINNPNQFIKGNINIVKQALEDILPIVDAYYQEHPDLKVARLPYSFLRSQIMVLVNDMARGSERIKSIVESLKRFARRDEGLLIDTVDLNTIISESARLVHNQVHKFAHVHLDFAQNLPTFNGNSQKIEQVIINLVINASQAMPKGKKGNIWIKTFLEKEEIVFQIKDDAAGMSEKTLKHIFDPFFTTKRAKGGTGLGLSIVYRIIEEHGGMMLVDSALGKGTTFTVRIPVTLALQKQSEELT